MKSKTNSFKGPIRLKNLFPGSPRNRKKWSNLTDIKKVRKEYQVSQLGWNRLTLRHKPPSHMKRDTQMSYSKSGNWIHS